MFTSFKTLILPLHDHYHHHHHHHHPHHHHHLHQRRRYISIIHHQFSKLYIFVTAPPRPSCFPVLQLPPLKFVTLFFNLPFLLLLLLNVPFSSPLTTFALYYYFHSSSPTTPLSLLLTLLLLSSPTPSLCFLPLILHFIYILFSSHSLSLL
uniref:Uncharacterized protein n=1 Tax=Octopus bimaculoides TaxID=37653 RepID=A0A0L8FXM7_OCTBM